MSNTLNALDELSETLAGAVSREDWNMVTTLDTEVHRLVEMAVAEARAGDVAVEAVQGRLDHLQNLYENAREKATRSRDQASDSLQRLGKTRKAASAYIDNSAGESKTPKSK